MRLFRQERIARILGSGKISSQKELVRRLRSDRIRVSQATLSRDLHELGVIRGPDGYRLPGDLREAAASSRQHSDHILKEFVRSVAAAGSLAVIKTEPGHAHTLGVAIDLARWDEVIGSIAGDDTVFVAAADRASADRIVQRIRSLVA